MATLSLSKVKVCYICFYCKRIESFNLQSNKCIHCNRRKILIKVEYHKIRISKWYDIFNRRYKYEAVDPKYQYVMGQLASNKDVF